MIPVFTTQGGISQEGITALPLSRCETYWNGSIAPRYFLYSISCDPEALYLFARGFGSFRSISSLGTTTPSFVEGLWEGDVVELFIKEDGTSRYQEINITPDGQWWSATFSNPRIREEPCHYREIPLISGSMQDNRWYLYCRFPRSSLGVACSFTSLTKMNVCACFGDRERVYLSTAALGGQEADFHQPDLFTPALAIPMALGCALE